MRKAISLILVVSILLLAGNIFAMERKGVDLVVQQKDGTQVRGELITVKENSVLLMERESGADVTINFDEIRIFRIKKKSQAGTGFLFGGLLGAGIGAASYGEPGSIYEGFLHILIGGRVGMVLGGALLFGLIGAAISTTIEADKTIILEGKSELEIQAILERLRKKARVKNAQCEII